MKINYKVLYIARDSEEDRIGFMETWLSSSKLQYKRIRGVDINDPLSEDKYNTKKRLDTYGYHMSNGEIGCFLAHINCWKECLLLGHPVVVLENDVSPKNSEEFNKIIQDLLDNLDKFDIVRFTGIFQKHEKFSRTIKNLSFNFHLVQTYGDPLGTGGYMITPEASKKLLMKCQTIYKPVDIFLSSIWNHRLLYRTIKPYPLKTHNHGCDDDTVFIPTTMSNRSKPKQSAAKRLKIEFHRAKDDIRKFLYKPYNFFR